MQRTRFAVALGMLFFVAGCTGGENAKPADTGATAQSAASTPGEATPAPGGKVIVVEMITDEAGSRFEPSEVTAKKGDVIRYTLKAGVHNADFYPDSNAVKAGLPAATEMLQLPSQTHDVLVTMAPGTYYFHCDPHAALGMKGHLTVVE